MATIALSQPADQLRGIFTIGSVTSGTTGEYKITGNFNDLTGKYSKLNILVGDHIWDGKCDQYEIVSVTDLAPDVIVEVDKTNMTLTDPSTTVGILFRPTTNYDYPLSTPGTPAKLNSCIETYRAIKIDADISGAIGSDVRYDYVDVSGGNINFNIIDTQDGDNIVGTATIPIEDIAQALPNDIVMRGSFVQVIENTTGGSFAFDFDPELWLITRNGIVIEYEASPADVTDYGYSAGNLTLHSSAELTINDVIIIRSK